MILLFYFYFFYLLNSKLLVIFYSIIRLPEAGPMPFFDVYLHIYCNLLFTRRVEMTLMRF